MHPILAAAACSAALLLAACVADRPTPSATPPAAPRTAPTATSPAAPPSPAAAPAPQPVVRYVRSSWTELPGWQTDAVDAIEPAVRRQCEPAAVREALQQLCAKFAARGTQPLRAWIERELEPHAIETVHADGRVATDGLITGYYEPLLRGSRRPNGRYRTPLYRRPPDLLNVDLRAVAPQTADLRLRGRIDGTRVVPYFDRAAIETRGVLAGHELLWVDDAVEAFFLQVQGSGRVRLDDGQTVRVAYADQNGHPYHPIGRTLIERGLLARADADAPGIKAWLRTNPSQRDDVLRSNPSYVFFSEEPLPASQDGPRGSLGVPLTPLRSVAVDPRHVPLGAPVFIDTPHPLQAGRLSQAFVAQDTGGAIRGAPRADVFWGAGEAAERAAGRMRSDGRMWLLWPRGAPLPAAAGS